MFRQRRRWCPRSHRCLRSLGLRARLQRQHLSVNLRHRFLERLLRLTPDLRHIFAVLASTLRVMHTRDICTVKSTDTHSLVHLIEVLAALLLLLVFTVVVAEAFCVGFIEEVAHVAASEAVVVEHGEVKVGDVVRDVGEIWSKVRCWFQARRWGDLLFTGGGMYSISGSSASSLSPRIALSPRISSFVISAWETLGLALRAVALFCGCLSASVLRRVGRGVWKALDLAFVVLAPRGARVRGPVVHQDHTCIMKNISSYAGCRTYP